MADVATVIFGGYMLSLLLVGIYASRFTTHEPTSFYLADRKLGVLVLTFTLLATVVSSFTFFGVGAAASGTGAGLYAYMGLAAPFYSLLFVVIGVPLYRVGKRLDILTPAEYVRERYRSPVVVGTYLCVASVFLLAFVATQIIGGGVALETLLGIPYPFAVAFIALFMAVYIHISGMRGVVWSDLVQGVIVFCVLAGMFAFLNISVGGDAVVDRALTENPEIFSMAGPVGVWTPLYVLSYAVFFAVGVAAYPQLIQRYFSAGSMTVLKRSSLLYAAILIPMNFFAVTLGVWSLGFVDSPPNPDYLIPILIESVTHPVVFGIAMSAGIAALMSSADSQLLTLSSMASRDVYREYVDPEMSGRREVFVTQVFLVIGIALAFLLALARPSGIFQLGTLGIAGFAATAPAIFLGVYWDGATSHGAATSMIAGSATMIAYFLEVVPPTYQFGMHYGFIGVTVSFAVFLGVSLVTSSPAATEHRVSARSDD